MDGEPWLPEGLRERARTGRWKDPRGPGTENHPREKYTTEIAGKQKSERTNEWGEQGVEGGNDPGRGGRQSEVPPI